VGYVMKLGDLALESGLKLYFLQEMFLFSLSGLGLLKAEQSQCPWQIGCGGLDVPAACIPVSLMHQDRCRSC
jgi:hypothetical protein